MTRSLLAICVVLLCGLDARVVQDQEPAACGVVLLQDKPVILPRQALAPTAEEVQQEPPDGLKKLGVPSALKTLQGTDLKEPRDVLKKLGMSPAPPAEILKEALQGTDLEEVVDGLQPSSISSQQVNVSGTSSFSLGGFFSSIWGAITSAISSIGGTISTISSIESLVVDSLELTGPTSLQLALEVLAVFGAVVGAALVGQMADWCFPGSSVPGRPSYTVVFLLLASYGLLIPGLFGNLFVFLVGVSILGVKLELSQDADGDPGQISESTWSIIEVLLDTGGYVGAALLITYAVVLPLLKLVLLGLAECYRGSSSIAGLKFSRRCIHFVQFISKWACPDMFAYMLLVYLFRQIDESGTAVSAPSELRIGFTCFTTFCVASTISTLAITAPEVPLDDDESTALGSEPAAVRWIGLENLPAVVSVLVISCLSIFVTGMAMSCLSLTLDEGKIASSYGIPEWLCNLFGLSGISATVSLWQASLAMTSYALGGEATAAVAAVMLLIFVISILIVDLIVLLIVAVCVRWAALEPRDDEVVGWASEAMSWASCFKHISMLDVFIMGILVVGAAGSAYASYGVVLKFQMGMVWLGAAEVLHYAIYYLVHDAVHFLEEKQLRKSDEKGSGNVERKPKRIL